jgi:hypothetical protein
MTTKTRSRRAAAPAKSSIPQTLLRIVNSALDDMKAVNVKVLDVRHLTDITVAKPAEEVAAAPRRKVAARTRAAR